MRWGILSTARINRLVLESARESDDVEVIALASRDRERAERHARELGVERAYAGYDALLADLDVEAVYISLPNQLHHEWTLRSLAAGKHVLCEKPYSRRPAEVEEAFAAAERAGLVLSEGYMWRHNPQTWLLLDLLPRVGRLETIRATFCVTNTDLTNFRLRPELDGGSLMDLGCYCVSGARLLAGGEPVRVHAEQVIGDTGAEVRLTAVLRFRDDVLAELTSSLFADHESLEAIGADGSLLVPDPWHCRRGVVILNGEEHRVEPVLSYRLELENVAAVARGEAELLLGREDALGQARTIEALYRAAATASAVALS